MLTAQARRPAGGGFVGADAASPTWSLTSCQWAVRISAALAQTPLCGAEAVTAALPPPDALAALAWCAPPRRGPGHHDADH